MREIPSRRPGDASMATFNLMTENEEVFTGNFWVGTGFPSGIVIGESKRTMENKIQKLCKDVEKRVLWKYSVQERKGKVGEEQDEGNYD
jgi:hypothetical protein